MILEKSHRTQASPITGTRRYADCSSGTGARADILTLRAGILNILRVAQAAPACCASNLL